MSSEQRLYSYPYDSQLAGDGQGGVWILCETEDCEPQSGDWALWHVTREGERAFYRYPKDAKLAGDGCGGVWVLCETSTLSDPEQGARRGGLRRGRSRRGDVQRFSERPPRFPKHPGLEASQGLGRGCY